jgi:chaperone modulatory protein CbpM
MADSNIHQADAVLVEDEIHFTLVELGRACQADHEQLIALVDEGVLQPSGDGPQAWRFDGSALPRARAALRLCRDLELSAAGTALVLDLLDEIDSLRARLKRMGAR